MFTASSLERSFASWLSRLQRACDLDALARTSRAIQRARKIGGGADLLRLALTYGPGGCSLRETALRTSARSGVISDTAVTKRLAKAGLFLETLLAELLRMAWPAAPLPGGHRLVLVDATTITAPRGAAGSDRGDWRLHCRYSGHRFEAFTLTDARQAERLSRFSFAPRDVVVADRGYRGVPGLAEVRAAGADFVLRTGWQGFAWRDAAGACVSLSQLFAHVGADATGEAALFVTARDGTTLPVRVVAFGRSTAAAQSARDRTLDKARRNSRTVRPASLAAARHLYLVTSLSGPDWPPERLVAVYRVRWQIELAFKRLKSILHVDRLTTRDAALARTWIMAHLIACVMMEHLAGAMPAAPTLGRRHRTDPCGAI